MISNDELTREAIRITRALNGTWHGTSGTACCPAHDDRKPSLSISAGRRTILLHCFAGCDFTDIVQAIRLEGALERGRLLGTVEERPIATRDFAPLARRIWSEARALSGTLSERYLQGRGLVGPWSELRHHPRTPVGSGAGLSYRPAKIAAIRDNSGLIAIHRTILDPRTAHKATDLENPKMTLGKPKRGAVRLFKASRILGIAEGIETAKSAAAMLGIPVWAVLGNERFSQVEIPFDVSRLVLLPDRGPAGERAVALSLETHAAPGRSIETVLPPDGHNDWNDADCVGQGIPVPA
jgi:putative DNA primase/helicase